MSSSLRSAQYVVSNSEWQPKPEKVCDTIVQSLADLRARTDDFSRPAYTLPAQPIANV